MGREKIKRIFKNEEFWIIFVSVCFGMAFLLFRIGGDDVTFAKRVVERGIIPWTIDWYKTWSSRFFTPAVMGTILRAGGVGFALYMSLCAYLFLKAIMLLFSDGNRREIAVFAVFIFMLLPFYLLSEAGWVATSANYFGPQAAGIMGLVPIKKALKREKIKWWEFIAYCVCVIYGANVEHMCVVLLAAYTVAVIYLLCAKKNDWKIWLLELLCVLSLTYTLTCPGNWSRNAAEMRARFPEFEMLDLIDKAELGISTTMNWIFTNSNILIIVMCIMMSVFIWKRYKEPLYRAISIVPACALLALGPMRSIFNAMFPNFSTFSDGVGHLGAFMVETQGKGGGPIQFGFFLLLAVFICIEIVLLNDTIEDLLVDVVLVLAGVATRCSMGFSPTIYASGRRTYFTLMFCLAAAAVHIYANNFKYLNGSERHREIRKYAMGLLGGTNFLSLIALVVKAWS